MLELRKIVDRYRVDAHVADGSTATVYRVTHVWLHTPMILKHLRDGLPSDVAHAMWEEGRIQCGRHHQNVVAVHDALVIEGRPALVMELVDGPDLADWLDERPLPPLPEALFLFRGVLEGVQDAHQAGLVHRDLKPENVFLAHRKGMLPLPKVADFGLAKRGSARRGGHTLSGSFSLIGTPEYMAPEQLQDPGSVDQRADIFSLGAILYELATGQMAFDGDDVGDVIPKVQAGDYTPVREVRPDVPEALEELIDAMLHMVRGRRLATCGDAIRAIDRLGIASQG